MIPPGATHKAVTLGAGAVKNMRSFVGRGAKVSTPVTVGCGAIADLASTIARFSLYLLIASVTVALVAGYMWYVRYRAKFRRAAADGVIQPEELKQLGESNGWSITFAFAVVASVVMGGFVIAGKVAGEGDKGVLASTIPGMDKLQESLFRVEKKLDEVKADTAAIKSDTAVIKADTSGIKSDTARIAAGIEDIANRFDALAAQGGVIANAKTPEEHYHNARFHELGGDFATARKSYAEYLSANLDVLDPWLSYSTMLKAQEGRAGAAETLRYFGTKAPVRTASYETALALLEEPPLKKLEALATEHPDNGPLLYLISQEFSDAKRGDPTLADQRSEKQWLEKFRAAHTAGKFLKYFFDKKEAQKWLDTADARWAKLSAVPAAVLENPVSLTMMNSNSGWIVTFILTDYKVKELFYQLDGMGDFVSTGHLPQQNPQTGLPMVNLSLPLPNLTPGEHAIAVRYIDKDGKDNGPWTLKFSTASQQLAQSKQMLNLTAGSWLAFRDFDGKVLLYFTSVLTYRPVLKEIRYSLDSEALDREFKFKPSDEMFVPGDDVYLTVPGSTAHACVQLTYKDGTKSAVQKIVRKKP